MNYDGPGFAPANAESGRMAPGSLASSIPKIHLHCHLEGTLHAATFVELAEKHGVGLRYKPVMVPQARHDTAQDEKREIRSHFDSLRSLSASHKSVLRLGTASRRLAQDDIYAFANMQEFLYLFAAVSRSLKDPEDYARLAREFVEDALAQNVIYGELFISPPVWTFFHPSLDVRTTVEAIAGELRRARPRATFKLIADLTRNFGAERALQTAKTAAALTDLDVIGVGLGGDEARFPAHLFGEAFAFARAQGLHRVAHAGEADGAASVRDAVEALGAQRIGHGIRALEDQATLDLLATRRIPIEVCPTSNHLTGAALPEHPRAYEDLDRYGCIVTIDADDPALFETSITREYALVEAAAGPTALERYVGNAAEAAFADPAEKRAMHAQLSAAVAELRQRSGS